MEKYFEYKNEVFNSVMNGLWNPRCAIRVHREIMYASVHGARRRRLAHTQLELLRLYGVALLVLLW